LGGHNASICPGISIPVMITRVCFPMHLPCQDTKRPFSGRCATLSSHEGNRSILVGPFCRVYVELLPPRRNSPPTDAPTSHFYVLARPSSHHTREVARCWIRVSTLLCCEGYSVSNITIAGYGEIQSRNSRGSVNGWMATKIIITTTRILNTAWVIRTQWEWCRKAWPRVSCRFQAGHLTPFTSLNNPAIRSVCRGTLLET